MNLEILKNQYTEALAAEKLFIDNKKAYIERETNTLVDNKSSAIGYESLNYHTTTVMAEVYNKRAATGHYPEMLRPMGSYATMVYAPADSNPKDIRKKAAEIATASYEGALYRCGLSVSSAKARLAEGLKAAQSEREALDRYQQLQASIAEMLA